MKRNACRRYLLLIMLLFCACICLLTCACTEPGPGPVGETTETAPAVTVGDTGEATTATEAESGPAEVLLFENRTPLASELISGSAALSRPYQEGITYADGVAELKLAGKRLSFSSRFYGHDSAIDRDFYEYGWKYELRAVDSRYDGAAFFLCELTGDLYGDLVRYEEGVLTIRPAVVDTKNTFEYNGETHQSVYGDARSDYAFGDPITYTLSLPDATLRGTGDFDGNGYFDLLLLQADGTVVLGLTDERGITPTAVGVYSGEPSDLHCGDVDGDGRWDLVSIDGYTVTPLLNTGEGFVASQPCVMPFSQAYVCLTVGDVNNDRRADIVRYEVTEGVAVFRTLFGRGDGFFGPRPEELGEGKGNTNLYAVSERLRSTKISHFVIGDVSGDGVSDVLFYAASGTVKGLSLYIHTSEPPYDYSLFGLLTEDGSYIMYAGGRWYDRSEAVQNSTNGEGTGDGDHVLVYTSKDGVTWDRYIDGPMYYLGWEQGIEADHALGENWWAGNTLEPEVVYVDGVYHMLLQSTGETQSGFYGDYINYASSTDGIHFTRKTDSPVILPSPGKDFTQFLDVFGYEIGFNHQELIYVADDPDGKCFHLYVGHFKNGSFAGYVRIRSADPTCFYWSERDTTEGFSQIGNQIAYIPDYDGKGNYLYLRITFHDYTDEMGSRTVPTLQYSVDGLTFKGTGISLASVDVADPVTENNRNVYFLGFCTLNGTGEIPKQADGSYRLLYLATTANAPAGFPIFTSEAGAGEMSFRLD